MKRHRSTRAPPSYAMQIGDVYRLYCQTTNPPKNKYLVLAANRSYPVFLFINSNISDFINNKNLAHTQIQILREDHSFLHHDSWVCTHLPCGEFATDYFQSHNVQPVGAVSNALLGQLRQAVSTSRTIRRNTIAWILEDIDNEIARRNG